MKKTPFFFPSLGRTILAFTREDAEKIASWEMPEDTEDQTVQDAKAIDPAKVNNRGIPRRISNK